MTIYVVDTSVIIEKIVSKLVKKKEIEGTIVVPNAVVAELEAQANRGLEIGLIGLEELEELQNLHKENIIEIKFVGARPTPSQIAYAKSGEIDALIREIAFNENATLITADRVQRQSAKVFGINVKFIETRALKTKLEIEKLFDETTMSVHLKEDSLAYAKKGSPGNWKLEKISEKEFTTQQIQDMAKEIVEATKLDPKSFIEIQRPGSTIVQYKNFRIVIVKPPLSDGWEITAVKPIKRLSLEEYDIPDTIMDRIKNKARGIIIAGETGSGKSTFGRALAEFFVKQGKITKTIESPRDLDLPNEITQYGKNFASSEEIHDIILLSRPDNILFDEMRDTPDFRLYTDLRLAGSNLVGVLHAAAPIDAVQRFIGRLDVGMIPSVLDTIIFIERGKIEKLLTLRMVVKVPTGMVEADLARPVVEIIDFISSKISYEIYSYGEETVIIPVFEEKPNPAKLLAEKQLKLQMMKYCDDVEVQMLSDSKVAVYVPERDISRIIGKQGVMIEKIEKELGFSIDVRELKDFTQKKKDISYEINETGNSLIFKFADSFTNNLVSVYIGNEVLLSATIGKKAEIKVNKKSDIGRKLVYALNKNQNIFVKL
ncbi:MAG TPA: PINc/VapC family ATPase [Candidatus Nanoarchaeia archaeon]|nr:PINc/VapC family ATPase [Candidatus Nanoarchaeia archaeon]